MKLFTFDNLFYPALFVLYAIFVSPFILHNTEAILYTDQRNAWLGVFLLLILLLEIPAMHVLMRHSAWFAQQHAGTQKSSGLPMMLWLAHMLLVVIVYMQGLQALGWIDAGRSEDMGAEGLLLFLPVIKEIYVLMLIVMPAPKKYTDLPLRFAELGAFLFSCLAYTVFWLAIFRNTEFSTHIPILFFVELLIAAFFFLIFYCATRIPELWLHTHLPIESRAPGFWFITILLPVTLAVLPVIVQAYG